MEYRKVYVDVSVNISKDGSVRPRKIRYEDGTIYLIDQVKAVQKNAASLRVGGLGTMYTVMIRGQQAHLFDEDGRWFVEAKIVY